MGAGGEKVLMGVKMDVITFRVSRFDPDAGDEGYDEFDVEFEEGMSVLDGLLKIKAEQDDSLTFRTACTAGVCGSCAMEINGMPRLACRTQIGSELAKEPGWSEEIELNPLPGFRVIKDLVVDIDPFFDSIGRVRPYLISGEEPPKDQERLQSPEEMLRVDDPMKCIMCTACLSACPVEWLNGLYSGPAVLTKVARFAFDSRDDDEERMYTIDEDLWRCTTCSACLESCPKDIDIPEAIAGLRSFFVEKAKIPAETRDFLESTYTKGNPYGESVRARTGWTEGLEVEEYDGQRVLWYVGCAPSYDERAREVARSMAKVLDRMDESYGILGVEERCCGHPAKRAGEAGLFEELSEENGDLMRNSGAEVLLTNCAHGYHTFANEYPDLGLEVLHSTQYFERIVDKIEFSKKLDRRVTFHDSCYLGRYNGIYEGPRKVLESVPGLELVEMKRSRRKSLCCGGGGNHQWVEEPNYRATGERMANERAEEALETGADTLAVACPFCLLTLDAAITALGREGEIEVMAISELVANAI